MPISQDNTTYMIIPQEDGTFGVEVVNPMVLPVIITGFPTEVEAQEWVSNALNHPVEHYSSTVPGQTALM
jgi:hypothetical protein